MLRSTNQHRKYWKERNIDWKAAYFDTFNHPHRDFMIDKLSRKNFGSILEVGCASGPNLYRIKRAFPKAEVGGIDISKQAIETGKKLIGNAVVMEKGEATDLFLSDKSVDMTLTDACLIYIGRDKINKAMSEIKRVTRKEIMMFEFHSNSFWERLGLKWASGYNAYDYELLLHKHGFYDIQIQKLPDFWGGLPWSRFGYFITAKI